MKKKYIAPEAEMIGLDIESLLISATGRTYLSGDEIQHKNDNVNIDKGNDNGTLIIGYGGGTKDGGVTFGQGHSSDWDDDL